MGSKISRIYDKSYVAIRDTPREKLGAGTSFTYRVTWTSNWMMCDALMIMSGYLVVTMNYTTVAISCL